MPGCDECLCSVSSVVFIGSVLFVCVVDVIGVVILV